MSSNENRPVAPPATGPARPLTQADIQQFLQSLAPLSPDQLNTIVSFASSTPATAPPAATGPLGQFPSYQAGAAIAPPMPFTPISLQSTAASTAASTPPILDDGGRRGPSAAKTGKTTVGDIDKEIQQRMGKVTPSTRIITPTVSQQGKSLHLAKHATRAHDLIDDSDDDGSDQGADKEQQATDQVPDGQKPPKRAKGSPREDFRTLCKAARFVDGCETGEAKELHKVLVKEFPAAMERYREYSAFQSVYKKDADRVLKEIIAGALGRMKSGTAGSRYLCDVVHPAVTANGSWIDIDVIRTFFFCTMDDAGKPVAPTEKTDADKYRVSPLFSELLKSLRATKGDFLAKAGKLAAALEGESVEELSRNDVVAKIALRWKQVMAACLFAGLPHYVKANGGLLQATNPVACDWDAISVAGGKAMYYDIFEACDGMDQVKVDILKEGVRDGLMATTPAASAEKKRSGKKL